LEKAAGRTSEHAKRVARADLRKIGLQKNGRHVLGGRKLWMTPYENVKVGGKLQDASVRGVGGRTQVQPKQRKPRLERRSKTEEKRKKCSRGKRGELVGQVNGANRWGRKISRERGKTNGLP